MDSSTRLYATTREGRRPERACLRGPRNVTVNELMAPGVVRIMVGSDGDCGGLWIDMLADEAAEMARRLANAAENASLRLAARVSP